jgi:nucleoside-diphosphate-sugar epimerase
MSKKLVIGAAGQIGTELVIELRRIYGNENVIAADIKPPIKDIINEGVFETIDVTNSQSIKDVVTKHNIDEVYQLAALLSATAEKNLDLAWKLNIEGLFNVLNLAKEKIIKKIFWPSSIAVFGPNTPKNNTPQNTIMDPVTVYGISKLAGERWCEYYYKNYNVDVRSIRYPGLISYKNAPGGGTTDYAIDIFHHAIKHGNYACYIDRNTSLPMMYMEDAIRATIELMSADKNNISVHSSYNLSGFSFNPFEISEEIKKHIPGFEISYKPDFRNNMALTWPSKIVDQQAKKDWAWKPNFDLEKTTLIMLKTLKRSYSKENSVNLL